MHRSRLTRASQHLQEQFPLRPVGKMVLNANVDNWFAVSDRKLT